MELSQLSSLLFDPRPFPGSSFNEDPQKGNFLVTGIGATLGGVKALQDFFENVPSDSGIAYIVMLHLTRSHNGWLAEMLQFIANIPVILVSEKTKIKPDHILYSPF